MTRMCTRSLTRQSDDYESNFESSTTISLRNGKHEELPVNCISSDDSDSEDFSKSSISKLCSSTTRNTSAGKTSGRVIFERGNRSTHSPHKKLIQNQKKTSRGSISKPDIIYSDDSDDECRGLRMQTIATPKKQKSRTPAYDLEQICYTSPPKQKKTDRRNSPQTPHHNKIEQSEEVLTPSRLFVKLKLTSPTHDNVGNGLHGSNRKELFKESNRKCGNVKCDDKRSVYQNARKALHSTFPTDMPGREKEIFELKDFIRTHLENRTSASLYISGPPGTGKTASLNMILQEETILSEIRKVYVNCTAIKSPTAIYSRIAKELGIKVNGKTEKDHLTSVENFLKRSGKMILLILDEIDQLENKNQSILYTIFEWPSKQKRHLILVGIANALDLTDRTLPRLQARCELKPRLMNFPPYTKQQIVQIFTARLKSAGVLEVFSPVALQMLAGKVAAVSGDVRRALDIGRRVIELVDQSQKEEVLKSIENLASELVDKEAKKGDDKTKTKTVELKQVVYVLNNVYGTSQNLTDENEDTFPLQQKIIICSLVLMLKKARNKDITVGKLHEVYKRVCTKRNLMAVDQAEFVGLCSLIETRGIIKVTGKKEPRLHKVNLEWDEEEVAAALKDKQLMSTILQDDSCLGKM